VRSCTSAGALLLAVVVASTAAPARAEAAPALPWVTISPLKGTPDASPTTQISFLGVPAGDISQVSVRGSRSGGHRGKLEPYATGTGASYVLPRAFTPGELVSVTATEAVDGQHRSIGTSFTVGSLYVVPPPAPPGPLPAAAPGAVQALASLPQLHPPTVTVTTPAADPGLGDIFLAPKDGASQPGAMIVNPLGALVWFSPAPPGEEDADLRVQQYLGKTVLTYWQGRIALNHGIGTGVIDNTSYQTIASVRAGNGLSMDLHEFSLEPGGVAWITIYEPVYANLSSVGGSPHGIIEDCVVQEVDVRTGLVMFEWHAIGHVPLSASHWPVPHSSNSIWDWFHINTIDLEPDQNLLINSRNTWAAYQVGHTFGEILWSLGGRSSSFKLGPGVRFAWQHDATMLPDGTIQIFDNEDDPEIADASRGIDIALNFSTRTATLLHQYVDPGPPVLANSQGDVQQLPNDDHLIGWGAVGLVSELSASGALTFEMELAPNVASYRAYRFPWAATPSAPPAIVVTGVSTSTTQIAASWNGATAVASWQVLAGESPSALAPVGAPVASSGFETVIAAATSAPYVAVEALGAGDAVLATSAAASVTNS
jgi:Arylsulfotransferase (ASST)